MFALFTSWRGVPTTTTTRLRTLMLMRGWVGGARRCLWGDSGTVTDSHVASNRDSESAGLT